MAQAAVRPAWRGSTPTRRAVSSGELVLDPRSPEAIYSRWLQAGWVVHVHARSVVPNGPPNAWARHADGRNGRPIQYPFTPPPPGAWHSPWDVEALETWKIAIDRMLAWRARKPDLAPRRISWEFIPFPDDGGGARYSIFEQNVMCTHWLRGRWAAASFGS